MKKNDNGCIIGYITIILYSMSTNSSRAAILAKIASLESKIDKAAKELRKVKKHAHDAIVSASERADKRKVADLLKKVKKGK